MTNIPLTVSKPARYTGNELNTVKKDFHVSPCNGRTDMIRFALAFPDTYEIGMSHLGLKILYQILNMIDYVWAERVYAPWTDMEELMRKEGILLSSLESSTPLRSFDIVGFSLQYEMSYTNVLNMLDLAQIPLLSKDRDDSYPLIIAGGPCAFNPEPIADFIDLFVIGDGEEIVTEIVECYKTYKDLDKPKLLEKMAEIEGIYVPTLYSLEEQPNGMLVVSDGKKVRKRFVIDLDEAIFPVDYIVPFMRPIHDRAVIEIMRGCSRGCRFCQAGMIYRPVRERSSTTIEKLAEKVIENTGYEELSLSSLSTCDHSSIYRIVTYLVDSLGKEKHVSISLPSLRTDAFSLELAQKIESAGKTGLTFAPEVATDRLRNVINKDISKTHVLSTVESAFSSGWDTLKLYFMIGLPTETEDDVSEIASLIRAVLSVARQNNRRASLSVSISTFVPKAHTPFQWEQQLSIEEVRQKQRILIDRLGRNNRIDVSFHSPQLSFIEGVFARGDRRLSKVLLEAQRLGCKFDGWTEHFDFNKWMKAFTECGIDPSFYHKSRAFDQVLPWDHIDSGVKKEFLLAERNRAYHAEMTPDCRTGECSECGVCDEKVKVKLDKENNPVPSIQHPEFIAQNPVSRIRFQFSKGTEVKYTSHLDLISVFTRAFRRADIPIAYSLGFSPHPKISFSSALPVGTTSEAEFADIELDKSVEVEDFVSRVNAQLPFGVMILRAQEISLRAESLMAQTGFASYLVRIPESDCQITNDLEKKIQSIMSSDQIIVGRRQKSKRPDKQNVGNISQIDIKPYVKSIKLSGCDNGTLQLEMTLGDGGSNKVRPEEIVGLLFSDIAGDSEQYHKVSIPDIQKTEFFIENQGRFFSPMEFLEN